MSLAGPTGQEVRGVRRQVFLLGGMGILVVLVVLVVMSVVLIQTRRAATRLDATQEDFRKVLGDVRIAIEGNHRRILELFRDGAEVRAEPKGGNEIKREIQAAARESMDPEFREGWVALERSLAGLDEILEVCEDLRERWDRERGELEACRKGIAVVLEAIPTQASRIEGRRWLNGYARARAGDVEEKGMETFQPSDLHAEILQLGLCLEQIAVEERVDGLADAYWNRVAPALLRLRVHVLEMAGTDGELGPGLMAEFLRFLVLLTGSEHLEEESDGGMTGMEKGLMGMRYRLILLAEERERLRREAAERREEVLGVEWKIRGAIAAASREMIGGQVARLGNALWGILGVGWLSTLAMGFLATRVSGVLHRQWRTISEKNAQLREAVQEAERISGSLAQQKQALDEHAIVAVTDRKGRITYANEKFCRISGYTVEELVGQTHQLVNSGFHPREYFQEIYRQVGSGKAWHGEFRNQDRQGGIYWVDCTIVPFRDGNGRVSEYVAIQRDITGQKRREEELKEARRAAEAGNRAKSDFLATMSHEIRTPMNAILGFAGLLSETPLAGQQKEYLELIVTSGDALLRIVNDILDLSKVEAGKLTVDAVAFDLVRMVKEVAEVAGKRIREKGLGFRVKWEPGTPERAQGDPGRVRQVMLNLLGNAEKFTTSGEVSLEVGVEAGLKEGGSRVRITVQDTGVGIPVEKQGLLFQRFSQVDSSATRRHGGTGLGLVISRRLVELMGGEMGFESRVGEGSRFWFSLATPEMGSEPSRSGVGINGRTGIEAGAAGGIRVEVLRDLRVVTVTEKRERAEEVSGLLRAWGVTHEGVASVSRALEVLWEAADRGKGWDAVLLDESLDGRSRVRLVEALGADPALGGTGWVGLRWEGAGSDGEGPGERAIVEPGKRPEALRRALETLATREKNGLK